MEQNTNKYKIYQADKINRFNVRLQWVIGVLVVVQSFLNYDLDYALKLGMYLLPVVGITTILHFIPFKPFLKSLLIGSGGAVLGIVISLGFGGEFKYFLSYYISLIMVGLYFNTRLIISYQVLLNTAIILIYNLSPTSILPADHDGEFISMMFLFNIAIMVFAVMAKWGNEYIRNAEMKEEEASKLVKDLEKMLNNSKESATALDEGIANLNENMENISEISSSINAATQEIAAGVQEEAASIQRVLESTVAVGKSLSEVKDSSSRNAREADNAALLVEDGLKSIHEISVKMEDIGDIVNDVNKDMSSLNTNIEEISIILNSLIDISSKTNLLALNAAIEAARAGDAGRGFSVVADEVRKLAEISKKNVDMASEIINNITKMKNKTLEGVIRGDEATKEGLGLMKSVVMEFQKTLETFKNIKNLTSEEYRNIELINEKFRAIEEQISNIASISEEHAASIEEIQATIDEENNQISEINDSVKKLKIISERLDA